MPSAEMMVRWVKTLRRLETAEHPLRPSTILKLAKALGVEVAAITEPRSHDADHEEQTAPTAAGGTNDFSLEYLLPRRPPNFSTYAPETFSVSGARVAGNKMVNEAKSILRDHPGVSNSDIVKGTIVLRALEIYLALLRASCAHDKREEYETAEHEHSRDDFAIVDEMARARAAATGTSTDEALGRILREQVAVQGVLQTLRAHKKPLLLRPPVGHLGRTFRPEGNAPG